MKLIGPVIFAVCLVLLAGGYATSQWARLGGDPETYKRYALAVDVPPVKLLAGLLLVACIVAPFVRRSGEDQTK